MQLVTRRPLVLPVFRNGCWYDDFAVTGAVEPGYTLDYGLKTKTPQGIILSATTATKTSISLPTWYKKSNFELESVMRLPAGSECAISFRRSGDSDRNYVTLRSSNILQLYKAVAGVYTQLGSTTATSSKFQKVGLRCCGSRIEVFLNGVKVISVDEPDNSSNGLFQISSYDSTVGVAQGEWQYLAIKPL